MKLKNWFWGLFFLLAGAGIIINQLGYFGNINLFTLIFMIALIPIIIKSSVHVNFVGIIFPIAIMLILFDEPLGITELTPWPILFTALFVSIGLTIIFSKSHKWCLRHPKQVDTIINTEDDSIVDVEIHFGSSIKYINSENFKKGTFECSFGELKIYLDHAKISKDGAEIIVDVSFGAIELYLPKEWRIINNVNTSLGGFDEKHKCSNSNGPIITIKGNISLGGVEVIYI